MSFYLATGYHLSFIISSYHTFPFKLHQKQSWVGALKNSCYENFVRGPTKTYSMELFFLILFLACLDSDSIEHLQTAAFARYKNMQYYFFCMEIFVST